MNLAPFVNFCQETAIKLWGEEGQDTCIILDVRTAAEYAAGHIPGSMDRISSHLRSGRISQNLAGIRDVPYTVRWEHAGFRTMNFMQELGLCNVINIRGGISAWTDTGLPVEK